MRLFLTLVLVFVATAAYVCVAEAQAPPWSRTIKSANGKFVLVLLYPNRDQQKEYRRRLEQLWSSGSVPAQNVEDARVWLDAAEKVEDELRTRFPVTGLYTGESEPRLIWATQDFDPAAWYAVSNDGVHMASGLSAIEGQVTETHTRNNPDVPEVSDVRPNLDSVVLRFYSNGHLIKCISADQLISRSDILDKTTSNTFLWSENGQIDDALGQVIIKKRNGSTITFDFNGEPIDGSRTAACTGSFLALGITFWAVFRESYKACPSFPRDRYGNRSFVPGWSHRHSRQLSDYVQPQL